MGLFTKVEQYVKEHHMLQEGTKVVLGLSGGADSVCLFSVLLKFRETMGLSLTAVHVNHMIRGEQAERDQKFAETLCKNNDVTCITVCEPVEKIAKENGWSVEEAGRIVRYQKFEEIRKAVAADVVAVAHNANDTAETMLFHLFRGTGISGLAGIAPANGTIVRPLLCVTREEIEEYLSGEGLSFITDESNFSMDYTRNRIRHKILPEAEIINEKAVLHMGKTAEYLREAEEYLSMMEEKYYKEVCRRDGTGSVTILTAALSQIPAIMQKRICLRVLKEVSGTQKDIASVHVTDLHQLCQNQSGRKLSFPYGMSAEKEYDSVTVEKKPVQEIENYGKMEPVMLEQQGEILIPQMNAVFRYSVEEVTREIANIPKNNYTKWLDYDKISSVVLLRNREPGDYMEIDSAGHKKKLKEILINEKIPLREREHMVFLAEKNHIIWIPGGRISEKYKITPDTRRILKVEITGSGDIQKKQDDK